MSIYFNYAATEVTDPLERLKLFLAANIAQAYYDVLIEKPLNPVLGETYHTLGQDGAKIYVEQTSHHPPRSHWYIDGPDGNYTITGYGAFDVKAGPRMASIIISGHKKVILKWHIHNISLYANNHREEGSSIVGAIQIYPSISTP